VVNQVPPTFSSILFDTDTENLPTLTAEEPTCFRDLNLDQILATVTSGREEYQLSEYFYTSLSDVDGVRYRQAVYADVGIDTVHAHVKAFAEGMRVHREALAQVRKLHSARQRQFWLLGAITGYLHTVHTLADALEGDDLASSGMRAFRDWLRAYVSGDTFRGLEKQSAQVWAALDAIEYTMHIDGLKVSVSPGAPDPDYSAEVEATFARFQQGETESHLTSFRTWVEVDVVEENVLALVAGLYPNEFRALDAFITAQIDRYVDPLVVRLDREFQFYLSYRDHLSRLSAAGLTFCTPTVSGNKAVRAQDTFDLALADKLATTHSPIVTNGFELGEQERVIVVTGANQGGKTTFSRTFGQLHWLANLGLPVAGSEASLFLFDDLFTHYEKQEDINSLHGKLEDELVRIHEILETATASSIIIMNEIFNSTTLDDAVLLGTAVLRQIIDRDILCLCVTFIDELTTLSDTTVSMVAAVDSTDPTSRTFHLERRPADGLAYAVALADKYGLNHDHMLERIGS
jgi:hypothetical protein